MNIDIIDYTAAQFAALSAAQITEIKEAQEKKNKLTSALEESLREEKSRLSENGILRSAQWGLIEAQLRAEYATAVENLREGLLFYLRYSASEEDESAPYEVNYALTETERFKIVKEYYETTYADGTKRFKAFEADKIAPKYLGELYAPLYDYFLEDVT